MKRRPAILVVLAAAALSTSASAETDSERADALFQDARAAVRQGNWEKACPEFAESLKLDPAPGTRINLGECEERAGHLVAAWALYDRAAQELGASDPRLPIARQRASATDARIPRVVVPEGTSVRIDSDGQPKTGDVRVDPGRHTLVVLGTQQSVVLTLVERDRQTFVPSAPLAPAAPVVFPSTGTPTRKVVGYATGSVGLAAITVGLVLGGVALHDKSVVDAECDAGTCSQRGLDAKGDGRAAATISSIAVGAGIAVLAAGIYLVVSTPKDHAAAGARGLYLRF